MTTGSPTSPTVLVVIVNYRTAGLAIDCLRSLGPEVAGRPGTRVVVVENASGDDSADRLASAIADEGWGSWASLAVAGRNAGFAAGNNVAIAPALASTSPPGLVWLLNPDTIVRPGAFGALVDFLDRRPDVGLAGSRAERLDGSPIPSAFRFPSALSELEEGARLGPVSRLLAHRLIMPPVSDEEVRTDWAAGFSLLIRRQVFEAIGLLDEGYFMYYEEVDFCLKAARAGWPTWYVPSSRVVHLIGQSSRVTSQAERLKRRPRYWFESRRRFFLRNYGRGRTLAADLAFALGFGSYRVRSLIQRKPDIDPRWFLRDFLRHNFLPVKR